MIVLTGCIGSGGSTGRSSSYDRTIYVKSPNMNYGKKYHFIIEHRFKTSSHGIDNIFKKSKIITQYHIYTDSLNKVSGDKILFATSKSGRAYKLDSKSIFIFNKDSLVIKNMQWCDRLLKKCKDSTFNKKYLLRDFSLLTKGYKDIDNSSSQGYFK